MVERILVTGANGYLGKSFIEEISDHHVYALVRSEKAYLDLTNFIQDRNIQNTEVINCDYADLAKIKQIIND